MIRILNPNKETLMQHIKTCKGNVYLSLKDGTSCDLKNDQMAIRLFQTLDVPRNGIMINITDPVDLPQFIQYLMETPAVAS